MKSKPSIGRKRSKIPKNEVILARRRRKKWGSLRSLSHTPRGGGGVGRCTERHKVIFKKSLRLKPYGGDGDVVTGSLKPVIAYIVIWRPKVHLISDVRSQRWLIIGQNPWNPVQTHTWTRSKNFQIQNLSTQSEDISLQTLPAVKSLIFDLGWSAKSEFWVVWAKVVMFSKFFLRVQVLFSTEIKFYAILMSGIGYPIS